MSCETRFRRLSSSCASRERLESNLLLRYEASAIPTPQIARAEFSMIRNNRKELRAGVLSNVRELGLIRGEGSEPVVLVYVVERYNASRGTVPAAPSTLTIERCDLPMTSSKNTRICSACNQPFEPHLIPYSHNDSRSGVLRTGFRLARGYTCSSECRLFTRKYKTVRFQHGLTRTPEHNTWMRMKGRCFNPNSQDYKHYGGRGITVCEQWRTSFATFFADMGLKPFPKAEIERLDNNGDYTPQNCVWATRTQQMRNTRRSVLLTYNGEIKTISQWAKETGIHYQTFYARVKKWGNNDCIFYPPDLSSIRRLKSSYKSEAILK